MRLAALLPYAAVGALIVLASSVALFSAAPGGSIGPGSAPTLAPATGGTPRAVPELSKEARLAYWREGRLWVSGLDGSLRRGVAQIDDPGRVSQMRWSPDGEWIAFVDGGFALRVVRTDGTRRDVELPVTLQGQAWRIADIHWSTGSTRIAATFLRSADGRSDAFVTDLRPSLRTWTRVTQMNDLFVGDWISERELLASTAGGVVAIVEVPDELATGLEPASVRPISGALGTSPILASDGRIHFLAGRVPTSRDPALPFITVSRAGIWSVAADGSDVRREWLGELNDVRLDARLPDGRYLVHRGFTSAQSVTASDVVALPANGGLVERVRLGPDGKTAYGFTRERIVRLDITRVGHPDPAQPEASVTVFLDTSGEADVWFPQRTTVARGSEPPAAEPVARYAFSLGTHVWEMRPDGSAALIRAGQALRRTFLPVPKWSPTGDHLLLLEQAGLGAPTTALVAVVIDRDGEQTRLADTYAAARSFAWAPRGDEVAVVVDKRGINGTASDAQLEVRFMDTAGKATRPPVPGREVAWTADGVLVLGEVEGTPVVQLLGDTGARTFVRYGTLVGDPRVMDPGRFSSWSGLDARPDGSAASVRLNSSDGTVGYFVLLDQAGRPIEYFRGDPDVSEPAWSPARTLIGYTLGLRTANERAVVHEPGAGPLMVESGRFAGWSPDGEWFYVGRTTGLYAYPLAGGAAVRVGPIGVPAGITAAP